MGWLTWIGLGLVVGVLAKWLMPGKGPGGLIATILLGILGALFGSWLASMLGFGAMADFSLAGLAIATGGAMLLLFVYSKVR
ncbi:MAG: GlsB/YeaQ/YmgE family stress response membrane protein [Planctomycetes bacterium]|nr:GlsB/YeaQ/YmgE family stress response membrane protein [Planctomycetota bacterium]MCC7170779.1 GlsB/YeaQ/YmgE family stress response membrane protein [Planctomycetota bacterium]